MTHLLAPVRTGDLDHRIVQNENTRKSRIVEADQVPGTDSVYVPVLKRIGRRHLHGHQQGVP